MTEQTITIPSQSYYTIMVYDLQPEEVNSFFAAADGMEDNELKQLTETSLDYLMDRVQEHTHSKKDDNLPDTDDIREKIRVLEKWRKEYSEDQPDDYLEHNLQQ